MKVRIRWGSRGPQDPAAAPIAESEPDIIGGRMTAAYGASDPGCVRTNNEDYFLVDPALGLYLVADGMGGAQAGEHASKLAAETVREVVSKAVAANGNRDPRILIQAFEEANRRVMEKASHDPSMEGMGTTLVAALENKEELQIANVGDSRVYLFENGRLHTITEDQTWVNEVGRRLGLDEESLKTHPMRHVLTMAIGVSEQLRVHTYTLKPASGMQVLLCSDGLHGVASEADVTEILASEKPLEAKCERLIEVARARGGPDNITAIILQSS